MAYKVTGFDIIDDTRRIINASVVGVGTTITTTGTTKLFVEGSSFISGIETASRFVSNIALGTAPISVASSTRVDNLNVQYLDGNESSFYRNASNLNAGAVPAAQVTQSSGLTITGNLNVSGNVTIGGTTTQLNAQQLRISDRDITLGVTTDVNGNDVSTDTTANHGGISIASTEGTPLINIPIQAGINTDPSTYKQIMWVRSGNYSGLATDAWIFNYGVSIGNTASVVNGSRLTVGTGFTVLATSTNITNLIVNDFATVGTAVSTNNASFNLINTNATTLNFGGAATTLNIGATSGTATINNPTVVGSQATQTLYNTVATTLNFGGAATALNMGATTGIATINNATLTLPNATTVNVNGANPTLASSSTGTLTLFNTNLTAVNAFGAATALNIGANTGITTIRNSLRITNALYDSGNLTGSAGQILVSSGSSVTWTTFGSSANPVGLASTATTVNTTSTTNSQNYFIPFVTNNTTTTGETVRVGAALSINPSTNTLFIANVNSGSTGIHTAGQYFVNTVKVLDTVSGQVSITGIQTIDATTKATLERELAFAPNQFDDLRVTGIATFANGPVLIGSGTSTGTVGQILQVTGGGYISTSTGIGITNPSRLLDVNGDVRFRGGIYDVNNNVGTANSVLTANGSGGWTWQSVSSVGGNTITVTNDTLTTTPLFPLFTSSSTGSISGANVDTSGLSYIPSGAGSLGIGTTSPTRNLDVNGDARIRGGIYDVNNNVGGASSVLTANGSGGWSWQPVTATGAINGITITDDNTGIRYPLFTSATSGSVTGQFVDSNGLVYNTATNCLGIGSLTPTSRLDIVGDVKVAGIITATDFNSSSDKTLKHDIHVIENPIEKVLQLNGVRFNWNETGKPSVGVIAQEVEQVLPELVSNTDPKSVNYNGLIGLLIECVKEQQKQIDELKVKKTTRRKKTT